MVQNLVCHVYLHNSTLVARIGSTVIPCVCETCFQTIALRLGEVVRVVLTNNSARFFMAKRVENKSPSVTYLLLVHSLVTNEQPIFLLPCSFPSLLSRNNTLFTHHILSRKSFLSEKNYEQIITSIRSIPSLKDRATIQFTILHRHLSCHIITLPVMHNRVTILQQVYEVSIDGKVFNVYRTEIVIPPVRALYSVILQEEGKLLPGATYCVENAGIEGESYVIDDKSLLHVVHPPMIPDHITPLSVSQTIRLSGGDSVWMFGILVDCMFTRLNGMCLIRVQDCHNQEIIQFWCGDYVERFQLGQMLVFVDLQKSNDEVVYTQDSSIFSIDEIPSYCVDSIEPAALEFYSYTWQSVDVISISVVDAYPICPFCENVISTDLHSCYSDVNPIILLSIHFIGVINNCQFVGKVSGEDAVRWLDLPEQRMKEITTCVHREGFWKHTNSIIIEPSRLRKLLGYMKMLCKKTSATSIVAMNVIPENPQIILEQLLRE